MSTTVSVSTEADCRELARTMRPEDLREVSASTTLAPEEVLLDGLKGVSFTARDEEGVILMFGAYPSGVHGVGLVWLLGTPRIARKKREFLRLCRPFLDLLHGQYPLLMNFADTRNTVHIRWLQWCGFRIMGTVPSPIDGTPFYEIARLKCVPSRP